MADALEVDVAAVLLATAKSLGLDVQRRQSELAAMLPSTADQLTSEQRDAVLAVVRAMTPTEEQQNVDQGSQSTSSDPAVDDEARSGGAPMKDELGTQADYELAANRAVPGPSMGERLHRRMEAAGEESQDHDYDDPA